ncbi:c-type cytochrome [Leisingera daeponensis]|uniref:c-type cytochrome n=1 Tax=Leisingera daeponensis TaxID=405746 RepID=UPI001C98B0E0|nr:c-type cytochrome [Leisingera daeponensis]MBY6058979.1 cytochrome c [Leisingera daeponensis]
MRMRLLAIAVVAVSGLAAAVGAETRQAAPEPVTFLGQIIAPKQVALGEALYAETCASCHGADLEGAPDWRRRNADGRMPAPPHDETGHTWHHSDRDLFNITRLGVGGVVPGYESDMPAYQGVLSDREIIEILAFIKSTWPERLRAAQARINEREGEGS